MRAEKSGSARDEHSCDARIFHVDVLAPAANGSSGSPPVSTGNVPSRVGAAYFGTNWLTAMTRLRSTQGIEAQSGSLQALTRVTILAKCGVDSLRTNRLNWLQINVLFALFRVLLHIKLAESLLPCF